jgi:hypothetical protein
MSTELNVSGAFGLLLFPDVKFPTSSHFSNTFTIDSHQGVVGGKIYSRYFLNVYVQCLQSMMFDAQLCLQAQLIPHREQSFYYEDQSSWEIVNVWRTSWRLSCLDYFNLRRKVYKIFVKIKYEIANMRKRLSFIVIFENVVTLVIWGGICWYIIHFTDLISVHDYLLVNNILN